MTKLLAIAALLLGVGCESVMNLDVVYAKSGDGGAGDGATDGGDAQPVGDGASSPCPCDYTIGLGCCLEKSGAAVCVALSSACADGVWVSCMGPAIDSVCCWNHLGDAGATTAFAATCGSRPSACETSADCANGIACQTVTCGPLVVGACGVTPACP